MSSGGVTIYAIIETGGKQYKVSPGESLKVESLEVAEGGTIVLDRVLAISDGQKLVWGKPLIEGASVSCTSRGDGKSPKIIGMKYKSKVRYSRKIGHRQSFTELVIDSISGAGIKGEKPVRAPRAEKAAEAVVEVEKPRRTRVKKAEAPAPAAKPARKAEKPAAKAEKPAAKPRRTTKKEEK